MEEKKMRAHDLMNDARRAYIEGKTDVAIDKIEEATEIYGEVLADDSVALAEYYSKLADALALKLDNSEKAIKYYSLASEQYLKHGNKGKSAYAKYTMGELYDIELDNLIESVNAFNDALALYMELDGMENMRAACLDRLAELYIRLEDYDIAKDAIAKSIGIKMALSPNSVKTASALHNAGKKCFDMRALDEAMEYLKASRDIYLALEGEDGANYKMVKEEYAIVRAYKGSDLH